MSILEGLRMKSIKQQLKLIAALCAIAGSSFAAASPVGHLGVKQGECNTATDYCVYIVGDNTIADSSPVNADAYISVIIGGTEYKNSDKFSVSQSRGVLAAVNAQEMKEMNVSDVIVGVDTIDGKNISNCLIKASGEQIAPGTHTITLYKSNGGVGCKTQW